jgi:hypothetical protein
MVSVDPRFARVLAAVAVPAILTTAVLVGACGGGGSPTTPPTAAPTPAPITSPTPPPVMSACQRIGLGTGTGRDCPSQSPTFQAQVEAAMDQLIREQPQIFNLDAPGGPGIYQIASVGQYYVGLIERLDRMGLCADFDGEELQVKSDNSFNDQYDVQTSNNFILRGPTSYKSTCFPAAFPSSLTPPPSVAGCTLSGSREKACGRESATLLAPLEAAIDQVMREHPEYFNPGDTQPGTGFIKILNPDAYFRDLTIAITRQGGVCAYYDGEEMAIKRENRYSEQYDLYGGEGYARRGEGSYRVTCYPAAF